MERKVKTKHEEMRKRRAKSERQVRKEKSFILFSFSEPVGWKEAYFDDSDWPAVTLMPTKVAQLTSAASVTISVIATFYAVNMTQVVEEERRKERRGVKRREKRREGSSWPIRSLISLSLSFFLIFSYLFPSSNLPFSLYLECMYTTLGKRLLDMEP
jgi:hypothetical protein